MKTLEQLNELLPNYKINPVKNEFLHTDTKDGHSVYLSVVNDEYHLGWFSDSGFEDISTKDLGVIIQKSNELLS